MISLQDPWEERLNSAAFAALLVCWSALAFAPALVEIAFGVSVGLWLLSVLRVRRFPLEELNLQARLCLLGYLLIVIFSYFWSEYPSQSFRGFFKVLQQVMLFILTADLLNRRSRFTWFERVTLATFTVIVIDGFWQYLMLRDFLRGYAAADSTAGPRLSASFKSYGLLANYLICVLPVAAGIVLTRMKPNSKLRVLLLVVAGAGLLLLINTRSRGAIMSFAASMFLILLIRKRYLMVLCFIAAMGTLLLILPRNMIVHRDINKREQSLVERYHLWDRALQVVKAKPLTGTGINTYTVSHARYDKKGNARVRGYYAHNGYLQAAAETGIPSMVCLLGFFALLFRQSWQLSSRDGPRTPLYFGILAGLFSFFIFMGVDTVFHNPASSRLFWIMLGLLHAFAYYDRAQTRASTASEV